MRQALSKSKQSGQVIVEYLLLLAVAIATAMIIRQALIRPGATPGESGLVLKVWGNVLKTIAEDDPNSRN